VINRLISCSDLKLCSGSTAVTVMKWMHLVACVLTYFRIVKKSYLHCLMLTAKPFARKPLNTSVELRNNCGPAVNYKHAELLSFWWQDLKIKVKWLLKPQYLNDWLNVIKTEFSNFADKGKKLQMIKMSHWIKLMINSSSEPTAAKTPLSSSLLNELNTVWCNRDWLDYEDTEDEMIIRLHQWRKLKHQQCLKERLHTLL